jgi:hypothetical protein
MNDTHEFVVFVNLVLEVDMIVAQTFAGRTEALMSDGRRQAMLL